MDDEYKQENGMTSEDDKENEDEAMPDVLEVDEDDHDDDSDEIEMSKGEQVETGESSTERVYLPNQENGDDDIPLECDESAYVFCHHVTTSHPCLSFSVLKDDLGDKRADTFPVTMTLVAGTQAEKSHHNSIIIMKLSNMHPLKKKSNVKRDSNEDESDDDDDDEDDEDMKPILECATIHHSGCVNRLQATDLAGTPIVASWSESGRVTLWDISHPIKAVNNHHIMTNYVRNNEAPKPLFSFNGHQDEGYAIAWSNLSPGMLATGDCKKNIHLWKPLEGGSWHVDQRAYVGHTASVEDIQWSPNEESVMASCSADQSVRIWDLRAPPAKACMLTKDGAHSSDVNVISWNKLDSLLLSGGDDGEIKVWDLRAFPSKPALCTFKHHVAPITSVEWHPTDASAFAASGADDQLTLWDISIEIDTELEQKEGLSKEIADLPSQLLFIHQGQSEIKELHWHPQMPGVLVSTASTGFNVFRTISI